MKVAHARNQSGGYHYFLSLSARQLQRSLGGWSITGLPSACPPGERRQRQASREQRHISPAGAHPSLHLCLDHTAHGEREQHESVGERYGAEERRDPECAPQRSERRADGKYQEGHTYLGREWPPLRALS